MLASAIRKRLSITSVEPTMALLPLASFRSCPDYACIVPLDAIGEFVGARRPGINNSMGLSRFLAPGLVLLLFGPARASRQNTGTSPRGLASRSSAPSLAQLCKSRGSIHRGTYRVATPEELQAAAYGRPVIFLIHGSYYTASMAVTEGPRIRNDLAAHRAVAGCAGRHL